MAGTPAAFNTSVTARARVIASPKAEACADGSAATASPYPVTAMVAPFRLAAKAFTASASAGDRLDDPGSNETGVLAPAVGCGAAAIGTTTAGGEGTGTGAAAARGGGSAGRAGTSGAAKGVLSTGLRGAGDGGAAGASGGADAAGIVALAAGGDDAAGVGAFAGGGSVPAPNNDGDALGDDGSGSGAAAAL